MSATTKQNNMRQITIPVKVYDVAKQELILQFESINACAAHLGLHQNTVKYQQLHKIRNTTNNLGKTLAFR